MQRILSSLCIISLVVLLYYTGSKWNHVDNVQNTMLFSGDDIAKLENNYDKQDDPKLVEFIKQKWLVGPFKSQLVLQHKYKRDNSQVGQTPFVDALLGNKTHGFYIECGAANGEDFSNTLFFERFRSWDGLLIEPNPDFFKELLTKRRNAFMINSCLSTSMKAEKVMFLDAGYLGGINGTMDSSHMKAVRTYFNKRLEVQCFPLWFILLAINRTNIDYFSLDVEGPELEILGTIPWEKVHINVISVEYRSFDGKNIDVEKSIQKLKNIRQFFGETGLYREVGIIPWNKQANKERNEARGLDVIFKRI